MPFSKVKTLTIPRNSSLDVKKRHKIKKNLEHEIKFLGIFSLIT